ncbi:Smr/MutS family protein [Flavisericum labens]|uniref:Smr/MutS family protein n=1 Tax=Flavisericum labens TaxID=3377112 RepID=UPI00387AB199
MEVDLHINQLVKSTRGMTNHDMLTLQLDTARHKLEFAIANRIQKVVFIHGVGEGVLKLELEYLFGRYGNVKFYDANYQKYGLGATEVYILQNAKNR